MNSSEYIPGLSPADITQQYNIPAEKIIKLSSNENPYGCSPDVYDCLAQYNTKQICEYYPQVTAQPLIEAIKKVFPAYQDKYIVAGNGMDNILETLGRAILDSNSEIIVQEPTFIYYPMLAKWAGASIKSWTYNTSQNINNIKQLISAKTKLIFLCTPNNPTGEILSHKEIQEIIKYAEEHNIYIFVDEAYIEYADQASIINYIDSKYTNLIVGRTMSKAYGIANLRIGWAVLPQQLVNTYKSHATPFAVTGYSQQAGIASIQDQDFIQECVKNNSIQREYLYTELSALGLKVLPSQSNFIAIIPDNSLTINIPEELLKCGIIIRDLKIIYRITIGTAIQNQALIQALRDILIKHS